MMVRAVASYIWLPICKLNSSIAYSTISSNAVNTILSPNSIDADGHILTADPFFDPEEFQRQEPKFEKKSPKTEEKPGNPTSDLISKIKRIELSDYRVNDIQMYRQIIEDTIALCEDEIISPYISQCFKLKDINDAVDFIKKKKCTGKVLIDLKLKNSSDETTTTDKKDD